MVTRRIDGDAILRQVFRMLGDVPAAPPATAGDDWQPPRCDGYHAVVDGGVPPDAIRAPQTRRLRRSASGGPEGTDASGGR